MRTRYFNSSIITASIFAHLPFESTLPIAYVASLIDKQTDGNGRWLEPLASSRKTLADHGDHRRSKITAD